MREVRGNMGGRAVHLRLGNWGRWSHSPETQAIRPGLSRSVLHYSIRSIAVILVSCYLAVLIDAKALAQAEVAVEYADLAIRFVCAMSDQALLNRDLTKFMTEQTFTVVDESQIERSPRDSSHFLKLSGFDERQRIIQFFSMPSAPDTYVATLYTSPPTRHATDLESLLQKFILQELGCAIRSAVRRENDSGAADLHEDTIKQLRLLHNSP